LVDDVVPAMQRSRELKAFCARLLCRRIGKLIAAFSAREYTNFFNDAGYASK
jgi:hypothetical protein